MEVKTGLGKQELTQNYALRLLDVSLLAGLVGYLLLVGSVFYFNIILLIGFSIELIISVVYLQKGSDVKKKVKAAGQWKKLTWKEKLDLHEWRRSSKA